MFSKKINLFLLALGFFCLIGSQAFSQVLNKAYVEDPFKQEWPIVNLSPEGNKYAVGDRLVIIVDFENHGRIDSLIDTKIVRLVFYVRGEADDHWKIASSKQETRFDFPAVLESGRTAMFAKVVFDTSTLNVKGKFKIYTEILGANLKSNQLILEVENPAPALK